jgi:hypothetical protein
MTLGAWAQEFQTLIAGAIGFAGVIIALVLNAWYARNQRREERRHECQTLRAALLEELSINRRSLVHNIEGVKSADHLSEDGGFDVPTDPMDDAYRAFTHRIGLLPRAEVSKVMFAYLTLRQHNANLFRVGGPHPTSNRHLRVPVQKGPVLVGLLESGIGPIDEAIEVLERARDER